MRKIFQIDGLDGSMLSIGERQEHQQAALCLRDANGNEAYMLIGREQFRELSGLSYDFHWAPEPSPPVEELETKGVDDNPF